MKLEKWILRLLTHLVFVILYLLVNTSNIYSKMNDTNRAMKIFQSVDKVQIEVEQFYSNAKINLPFKKVAADFMKSAGLKVVEARGGAILKILAKGEALYSTYTYTTYEKNTTSTQYFAGYSGAAISGNISFEVHGKKVLKKSFSHRIEPPDSIGYGRYEKSEDAPFKIAFEKGFIPIITGMVDEIFKPAALVSLFKNKNIKSEIRKEAAIKLVKQKHPNTINILIEGLKDKDWKIRELAVST